MTSEELCLTQDAECAMTLLQLAQSAETSNVVDSDLDESDCSTRNRMSTVVAKEHTNTKQKWLTSRNNNLAEKPLPQLKRKSLEVKSEEHKYRDEIVKRIKLDHNYFWTGYGEFKYKVAKMLPTETVESLDECMGSKKCSRDSSAFTRFSPAVRPIPSPGPTPQCRMKIDLEGKVQKEKSPRKSDNFLNSIISSQENLYESDDKYRKFNLLLNCLVSQADSDILSDLQSRKEHDSDASSTLETGSIDENHLDQEGEFSCNFCCKTFSRHRYLTKHIRRLHSNCIVTEGKNIFALCPHCKQHVMDVNSTKGSSHLEQCQVFIERSKKSPKSPLPDTAVCQVCHVRLKRHMLVKHLAQEHCVEHKEETLEISDDIFFPQGLYNVETSSSHKEDVEFLTEKKFKVNISCKEEENVTMDDDILDVTSESSSGQITFESLTHSNSREPSPCSHGSCQTSTGILQVVKPSGSMQKPVSLKL